MIIKKLYLTSFGKFHNKEIELTDGINLIKGMNEAGKSTIHKFIEGMLFGFYKTGVSRKVLNDSHKAYMPRTRSEYLGSMLINYKGKDYFIERNFNKAKPSIKVTDYLSGKDITESLQHNNATRLPDLGAFLEIDYTMFNNTISVSQMENETNKDLASVVVEKLTNLNTTKDESISIAKVNDALEDLVKDIGTKNSKTKPLYLTTEKLAKLNLELEDSQKAYQLIANHQSEVSNIEKSIDLVEDSLNKLDSQKSIYENEKLKVTYYKVESLLINKEELISKTQKLEKFKNLSIDDYNSLVLINSKNNDLKSDISDLSIEINKLDETKNLQQGNINKHSYLLENDLNYLDIHKQYMEYRNLDNEIKTLIEEKNRLSNSKIDTFNLSELKQDYIAFKKNNITNFDTKIGELNSKKQLVQKDIELLETQLPKKVWRVLASILAVTILLIPILLIQNKKIKRINTQILEKRNENEELNNILDDEIKNQKSQIAQSNVILTKYNVESDIDLEILYQENSSKAQMAELNKKRLLEIASLLPEKEQKHNSLSKEVSNILAKVVNNDNLIQENMDKLKDIMMKYEALLSDFNTNIKKQSETTESFNSHTKLLEENQFRINQILKINNSDSLESFKNGLVKKDEYESIQIEINSLSTRIEDYLGIKTFIEIKEMIDFESSVVFDEDIYITLISKEGSLREDRLESNTKLSSLLQKISSIENNHRDLSIIKNEILINEEKLQELNNDLKSINLVINVLDDLSKEISYEFAPSLNKGVSDVVEKVTNGKYNDVKLDRNMDIKMFDNTSNKIESIHGFSKGTIDQVYLAMRIGINKIVSNNINPFILDDAFVNYDDERLEQVISIISNDSIDESRQVIMFSCQEREDKILDELKVKANKITL